MSEPIESRPWDSFPREVVLIRHLWIEMPDGCRLAARVWLPGDAETLPVPGILELIPYRKNDGTNLRDTRNGAYFAGHGYAVVRVDLRGTGDSEGVLLDEYTQTELDDGCAIIAWIAAQTWCTGKVGIMGISWGGFNGLQIAAEQPPDLAAVVSLCSTDDRYADDVHYFGGQLLADQQLSWATTMLAGNARPPDPEVWGEGWLEAWKDRLKATPPFIEPWMQHQRRDSFWQHGSIAEDPSAIRCPVMAVGGWADAYRDAVLRMLETLEVPRRGIIGPWTHMWPNFAVPDPKVGFLQEALRWWDRWLKDVPNEIEQEPMLLSFLQDSVPPQAYYASRPGSWIEDSNWPSSQVTERYAGLSVDKRVTFDQPSTSRGSENASSLTVTSMQAHGIAGGRSAAYGMSFEQAIDQRVDDGFALCFDSAPLTEDLVIVGIPEAELTLSADRPEAMVCVRLVDVSPDGQATLVTRGVLNLCHRDSHETPEQLEPGARYTVRFPLHAIGYTLPPGHRLRVALAPTMWPMVWPSPEPVALTIFPEDSRIVLPIHDATTGANFPFPHAEQASYDHVKLDPHESGTVTRDLARGTTQVVYEDSGGVRLPASDGELSHRSWDRDTFIVADSDPTTACAISERRLDIERADWRTRVEAFGRMTCDIENFYVTTHLTAWNGDDEVFTRRWEFTFPRDYT